MFRLIQSLVLALAAFAVLSFVAAPAEAHWGIRRAPVVAVRAPIVHYRAPVVAFRAPIYRQQFVAPIYQQQFVAPIYSQQFIAPQAVYGYQSFSAPIYSQQIGVGGGCGQLLLRGY